jgi:hypothetical protein
MRSRYSEDNFYFLFQVRSGYKELVYLEKYYNYIKRRNREDYRGVPKSC